MYSTVVFLAIVGCAFAAGPDGASIILKQNSEVNPDGSYRWSYESDNGIFAEENGNPGSASGAGLDARGQYGYTAPDGSLISLQYVANEGGFQPQGSHLPVAPVGPEIPVYILRALEWNAAHPEQDKQ